jgi:L-talarate/galactarate dehydratase
MPTQAHTEAPTITADRIRHVKLSTLTLPLDTPISDAKVLTGRQKPMTEIVFLFAEINTESGHHGIGFSYSKRAGGPAQYAHAREIADNLIGEDPNDIGKIYTKLLWAGASVGRSGVATQAIAAIDIALYDLKAKRAGLPLAKLLGAYRDSVQTYNTSGGFLHASIEEVKERATQSLAEGIGGIKIKVGQPDSRIDLSRVTAVREHLGDSVPLMVDANQQWDRTTAMRFGRVLEQFDLVWIEEPLDAYDAEGHGQLAAALDTPIATGEMLSSVNEHIALIEHRSVDIIQPDAPRSAGSPRSCGSRRWPTRPISSWHRTSRWRSTYTWRRPTRRSRGWSTSSGSTHSSMSGWRSAMGACGCPSALASASPSASRRTPGSPTPWNTARPDAVLGVVGARSLDKPSRRTRRWGPPCEPFGALLEQKQGKRSGNRDGGQVDHQLCGRTDCLARYPIGKGHCHVGRGRDCRH